jgi:hypothetical protein
MQATTASTEPRSNEGEQAGNAGIIDSLDQKLT